MMAHERVPLPIVARMEVQQTNRTPPKGLEDRKLIARRRVPIGGRDQFVVSGVRHSSEPKAEMRALHQRFA